MRHYLLILALLAHSFLPASAQPEPREIYQYDADGN